MKVLRDYEKAIEILIPSEVKRVVLTDKVVSERQRPFICFTCQDPLERFF